MHAWRMAAGAVVLGVVCASSVAAQVSQPDGTPIPTDPGCDGGNPTGLLPTFACVCNEPGVCNIGDVCESESSCDDGRNGTCESRMVHVFNDNTCIPSQSDGLDPRVDAATEPETFSPTCSLTFTVVSRGTALFENAFGWYNVTGSEPSTDDLHVMLPCDAGPGTEVVLDVRSEPDYAGGEIGFFLLTPENRSAGGSCAGGDCCATVDRFRAGEGWAYYSERDLNPDADGADSIIHLLTYDSRITERKFYFAWEDTFDAANNDFTDLVTGVEGVECAGAGDDCDTGGMGACQVGVTACEGGTLTCVPTFTGSAEVCNGTDDDCNGMVDDGDLCPGDEICANGECSPPCGAGEFLCPFTFDECDDATGLCIEPACVGVTCETGEVCRDGTCAAECEGIVCPAGTDCLLDRCVDLCEGIDCGVGEVCRRGLCVPGCNQCNGLICSGGLECDEGSSECTDPSCPSGCADGTVCDEGTCVDACEGAVCPREQVCMDGRCVPVEDPGDGGATTDGGSSGIDGGGVSDDGGPGGPGREDDGCGCRVPAGSRDGSPTAPLLLGLLGLALWIRRRRLRGRSRPRRP